MAPNAFVTVYESKQGIGGYPCTGQVDHLFAYDGSSSGKLDHLVLYAPGEGRCSVLRKWQGSMYPIYETADGGLGGFDLAFPKDRAFAYDYDHSGKPDHIFICRPGAGAVFILKHDGNGNFTPVYQQAATDAPVPGGDGNGIGGWDMRYAWDRCFAYDYDHSKKLDYIVIYRRASGACCILQNSNGKFQALYNKTSGGFGSYGMGSEADYMFAFDYTHSGCQDHFLYITGGPKRAGVIAHQGDNFVTVWQSTTGIGGFDLHSQYHKAIIMDYNSSGKNDHIMLWHPGFGVCFIMTSPNHDGNFTVKYQEGTTAGGSDNGGKGIGTWDVLDTLDHCISFDWDSSGCCDHLVWYRLGTGMISIVRRADNQPQPAQWG